MSVIYYPVVIKLAVTIDIDKSEIQLYETSLNVSTDMAQLSVFPIYLLDNVVLGFFKQNLNCFSSNECSVKSLFKTTSNQMIEMQQNAIK